MKPEVVIKITVIIMEKKNWERNFDLKKKTCQVYLPKKYLLLKVASSTWKTN